MARAQDGTANICAGLGRSFFFERTRDQGGGLLARSVAGLFVRAPSLSEPPFKFEEKILPRNFSGARLLTMPD